MYAYEDKTEKQFQESEDLDIYDWMVHRIYVQNMSDIDRRTILDLPSAERRGQWEDIEHAPDGLLYVTCSVCGKRQTVEATNYCGNCGARMEVE